MNKPLLNYDKEHDIMYIVLREGEENHFTEIADGVIVEYDEDNQPIGLEIFNASKVLLPLIGQETSVAAAA